MSFKRNAYAEATCTISHEDDAAFDLLNAVANTGMPTLRCYRRADNESRATLRFNGYLAPFQEDIEEAATLSLTFRSPLGRLTGDGSDRGRFTAANVVFVATDAGQIAKSLIDTTNSVDGPTGLATTGTIEVTKSRDRTYQFANVGEAVTNLTNVLDGFDMYEAFVDDQGATLAALNIVAAQGQLRDATRFEYGADTLSNVRSLTRTTQPPINVAQVLGANGLVSTQPDAASITKYGVWMTQASASDVSEQATLDDKAKALLRPNPVKTINFVPDFGLGNCPRPWDDFWLGDTVHFFARRGALSEDVQVRVNGVTVTIDDNGFETTEIPDDSLPGDVDPLHDNESDQFTTQPSVDTEVV